MEKNQNVDIIGVVTKVAARGSVNSKTTNQPIPKRNVTLMDQSLKCVDVTLWGDLVDHVTEDSVGVVVAMRGARLSDFGGRTLNAGQSTLVVVNPDLPQASNLLGWHASLGHVQAESISASRGGGDWSNDVRKTFGQIKEENLGFNPEGKADYFSVKGTITFIRHEQEKPPFYRACPGDRCSKKVIEEDMGSFKQYRCEKCQKAYDYYDARYILSFSAADGTGNSMLNTFNEIAESIMLGQKAKDLEMFLQDSKEQFDLAFTQACWKTYVFSCRAKAETVQDDLRNKITVVKVAPINFVDESRLLLNEIQQLLH
eukprot:TRINITY_DN7211_c0_g1_i3.p1 TRINITY_DN7211_c0_g1~~TRINITY_DN7211_c0_g1_i3.p1  ORF type:complete len:333 (-),score=63.47 TRINITY_DN7211_c0_g1_i3:167-1108(-)